MQIADLAHHILGQNPNSGIFSLGQSPAWIVKAIDLESKHKGGTSRTGFIPFSGNFLHLYNENNSHFRYTIDDAAFKTADAKTKRYRQLLTTLGLDPESIIERHQKSKNTTTIVEFFNEGNGIASFLYTLLSWAQNERCEDGLRQALKIHLLNYEADNSGTLKLPGFRKMPCAFFKIESSIAHKLWNCPTDVRIVPSHCRQDWGKPLKPAEGDEALTTRIETSLAQAVALLNDDPSAIRQMFLDRKTAAREHSALLERPLQGRPPLYYVSVLG